MQEQQIKHFNREIPSYQEELLALLEAVTDPAITHLALNDLFHVVLDRICAITMADNLAVLLLNEERTFLRPRAVVGVEKVVSDDVQIPFGRGFAGRIAALAAPVVIYDPSVDDVITSVLREQLHSLLGVPLIVHEQVIGVVHIGLKRNYSFTDHDIALNEQLERVNALQSTFISVVGHEFRTALTGIEGFSSLLIEEEFTPEEAKEFAHDINKDALRLHHMVTDLLDLEQMKKGKRTSMCTLASRITILAFHPQESRIFLRPISVLHHNSHAIFKVRDSVWASSSRSLSYTRAASGSRVRWGRVRSFM